MAIINYDTWMQDTARFGLRSSDELKAIDTAFLTYEKLGTGAALQGLQRAFDAWAATKGPGEAHGHVLLLPSRVALVHTKMFPVA